MLLFFLTLKIFLRELKISLEIRYIFTVLPNYVCSLLFFNRYLLYVFAINEYEL